MNFSEVRKNISRLEMIVIGLLIFTLILNGIQSFTSDTPNFMSIVYLMIALLFTNLFSYSVKQILQAIEECREPSE